MGILEMSATMNGAKPRRKVVLCGDYRRFIAWCRQNDVAPMSVHLVDRREKLLGLELRREDIVDLSPVDGLSWVDVEMRIRLMNSYPE